MVYTIYIADLWTFDPKELGHLKALLHGSHNILVLITTQYETSLTSWMRGVGVGRGEERDA